MKLFNDSFFNLVQNKIISPKEAYMKAVEKEDLLRKFRETGIKFDPKADL